MEAVLKHLECPVCLVIPDGKIFQCYNSHPICESCIGQCTHCPQCNLIFSLEHNRLRCLPLEAIRDDLDGNCKYEEHGCPEWMKRKYLPAHHSVCVFRPTNVCRLLGYENCDFLANNNNIDSSLIDHLQYTHEIKVYNDLVLFSLPRTYNNIQTYVMTWIHEESSGYVPDTKVNTLIRLQNLFFLQCWVFNNVNCSLISLCLGVNAEEVSKTYKVQCSIYNREDNNEMQTFECKWTTPVFSWRDLEKLLMNPPSPVALSLLDNIPMVDSESEDTSAYTELYLTGNIVRV